MGSSQNLTTLTRKKITRVCLSTNVVDPSIVLLSSFFKHETMATSVECHITIICDVVRSVRDDATLSKLNYQ